MENVIQLNDPSITATLLVPLEDEVKDEDVDDEDDDEDEEVCVFTTILGSGLTIDTDESSGREIADMSAAVVSTGIPANMSSSSSNVGAIPIGISMSTPRLPFIVENEDPMSNV